MPHQCWFVTRNKCYDFDYRWNLGGIILSDKLIDSLFCSEKMKAEMKKLNFKGVNFISIDKYKQEIHFLQSTITLTGGGLKS